VDDDFYGFGYAQMMLLHSVSSRQRYPAGFACPPNRIHPGEDSALFGPPVACGASQGLLKLWPKTKPLRECVRSAPSRRDASKACGPAVEASRIVWVHMRRILAAQYDSRSLGSGAWDIVVRVCASVWQAMTSHRVSAGPGTLTHSSKWSRWRDSGISFMQSVAQ